MQRNIIWDLDGTLFDTYPAMTAAFVSALRDHGKGVDPARVGSLASISFDHCVSTLAGSFGLSAALIEEGFASHYGRIPYSEQRPFPGVRLVCEHICGMGGQNVIVTHRGLEGTVGLLEAHGMKALFTGWLTQADGYRKKPDPEAFDAAIRLYGLERGETIAVGDRDLDLQAARRAGLFCCRYGSLPGAEIPDLAVTAYIQLLEHLAEKGASATERC
jgi:phosphoglycolate phosphatase-like HAD superfamily hydrolase